MRVFRLVRQLVLDYNFKPPLTLRPWVMEMWGLESWKFIFFKLIGMKKDWCCSRCIKISSDLNSWVLLFLRSFSLQTGRLEAEINSYITAKKQKKSMKSRELQTCIHLLYIVAYTCGFTHFNTLYIDVYIFLSQVNGLGTLQTYIYGERFLYRCGNAHSYLSIK